MTLSHRYVCVAQTATEAAEDRLAPILEKYFQSDDRVARVAATDALAVLLSDESRDAEALRVCDSYLHSDSVTNAQSVRRWCFRRPL